MARRVVESTLVTGAIGVGYGNGGGQACTWGGRVPRLAVGAAEWRGGEDGWFGHRAARVVLASALRVAFSLFHPLTNSMLSAAAQAALYIAVLAPLFWVPRMKVDEQMLRRAMRLIWLFSLCSAAAGVLQVYFPGQ